MYSPVAGRLAVATSSHLQYGTYWANHIERQSFEILEKALSPLLTFRRLGVGVRADFAVQPLAAHKDAPWLPIQGKACNGAVRSRPNTFSFNKVSDYAEMPVVCHELSGGRVWRFNGNDLTMLAHRLKISLGCKWDIESCRCSFNPEDAHFLGHRLLGDYHSGLYPLRMWEDMQRQASSADLARIEVSRVGDLALRSCSLESRYPSLCGAMVHREVMVPGAVVAVHETMARAARGKFGMQVRFRIGANTERHLCADSIDMLFVYLPRANEQHSRFLYAIPSPILAKRGLLKDGAQVIAKKGFLVYPPGTPSSGHERDEWANDYLLDLDDEAGTKVRLMRLLRESSEWREERSGRCLGSTN